MFKINSQLCSRTLARPGPSLERWFVWLQSLSTHHHWWWLSHHSNFACLRPVAGCEQAPTAVPRPRAASAYREHRATLAVGPCEGRHALPGGQRLPQLEALALDRLAWCAKVSSLAWTETICAYTGLKPVGDHRGLPWINNYIHLHFLQ